MENRSKDKDQTVLLLTPILKQKQNIYRPEAMK